MRIDPTNPAAMPISARPTPTHGSGFTNLFMDSVGEVNKQQLDVENLMERLSAGERINPAVVAAAVNKADLAFRTMIQIRNKLTEAFDELRRMQV